MIPTESSSSAVVVFSSDETKVLKAIMRQNPQLEVIIPPNSSAEELWRTMEICIKGLNWMTDGLCWLKPIIGRIMVRFEDKPSLYKELGYNTFHDFKFRGVAENLGCKKNWIYEALELARDWKQITPEQYVKIGPRKLQILSEFARGNSANAGALLQKAETMKVTEFRDWAEDSGNITVGSATPKTIHIHTTLEIYRFWEEFRKSEDIQAVYKTADPGKILERLMQSHYNELLIQGATIIADRKEKEQDDSIRNIDIHEGDASEDGGEDSQSEPSGHTHAGG